MMNKRVFRSRVRISDDEQEIWGGRIMVMHLVYEPHPEINGAVAPVIDVWTEEFTPEDWDASNWSKRTVRVVGTATPYDADLWWAIGSVIEQTQTQQIGWHVIERVNTDG